ERRGFGNQCHEQPIVSKKRCGGCSFEYAERARWSELWDAATHGRRTGGNELGRRATANEGIQLVQALLQVLYQLRARNGNPPCKKGFESNLMRTRNPEI